MLNYVVKHASSAARPLGIIMLMYSGIGVIVSKLRRGADDEANTVLSAGLTGLLFRSVGGWKGSLKGAGIGAGIGCLACVLNPNSRENLKNIYRSMGLRNT